MIRISILSTILLCCATNAVGAETTSPAATPQTQMPDQEKQRQAMSKLSFMQGRWIGQSPRFGPNGEIITRRVDNDIESRLKGEVLTITGRTYAPGVAGGPHADISADSESYYALVSFDDAENTYILRAYFRGAILDSKGGMTSENEIALLRKTPQADIRSTFRRADEDSWIETSETSVDGGKTWTKVFEARYLRGK